MCKYCEEIYIYKNADIALKRYKYRIEYKDGKFNTIADDEVYELQNITHCPWCGRKLEATKEEKKAVVLTQEGYDDLEKRIRKLEQTVIDLGKAQHALGLDHCARNGF